jgi:hypothetical protein
MDPTKLIEVILDKGVLGALLIGSLWANLKLYQQVRAEHAERLQDKDKATSAILEQSNRAHNMVDRLTDVFEAMTGKKIAP